MSASKRYLLPASALALVAAGFLHGCGGSACLRDSDCDSELECRRGACLAPLPKNPAGVGGQDADAGDPDASTGNAGRANGGRPNGSTPNAGKSGASSAGAAGEGGGGVSF